MWEGGNVCTGSRKLGIHAQIEKKGCTGSRRLGIHAQIVKKKERAAPVPERSAPVPASSELPPAILISNGTWCKFIWEIYGKKGGGNVCTGSGQKARRNGLPGIMRCNFDLR